MKRLNKRAFKMMMEDDHSEPTSLISSAEIATYTVCPQAWQLKRRNRHARSRDERTDQGRQLRREWVEKQDLYSQLKHYAKITYLLLVAIVIVVFLIENHRVESQKNVTPASSSGKGDVQ